MPMTQEALQKIMRDACTLEEVQAARQLVVEWLKDHPDDQTILGEGESLIMLEEWLLYQKFGRGLGNLEKK